jgi:hypothetical protein
MIMVLLNFSNQRPKWDAAVNLNDNGDDDPSSSTAAGGEPDGQEDLQNRVAQWQRDLRGLLNRLEPYLVAGRMVTFEKLTAEEKTFFAGLAQTVSIPETVCAVFIPPSVIQQAMWPGSRPTIDDEASQVYGIAPDAGAVVAVRCGSLNTIVNALFALPPLAPGIDVYEDDRLLAGYTYHDHRECTEGLIEALKTYLVP